MSAASPRRRRPWVAAAAFAALLAAGIVLLLMRGFEPDPPSGADERAATTDTAPRGLAPSTLEAKPAIADGDASSEATSVPVSVAGASGASPDGALPLREISVVDAETGRALGPDDFDGFRLTIAESGSKAILGWSSTGRGATLAVPRRGPIAPRSWVTDSWPTLSLARPMDASVATAVVPMRRVLEVHVRPVDSSGRALRDAHVLSARLAGRGVLDREHVETLGGGAPFVDDARPTAVPRARGSAPPSDPILVLSRVPFFALEPLWVVVAASIPRESRTSAMRQIADESEVVRAFGGVVLPMQWQPRVDLVVTFDDAHLASDSDLPTEESFGEGGMSPIDVTVRVRVVARDGAPSKGAVVSVDSKEAITGDDGTVVVTVKNVAVPFAVSLVDRSMTPVTEIVRPASAVVDVVLREPEPASLEVFARFSDGRPAAYAQLRFATPSDVAPLDLVDGRLRLDSYTDADGHRVFTHVEPALVHVTARWGSRQATESTTLAPGRRGLVRIVLPDPSTDPPTDLGATETGSK